jgi:hypothetical protein
VSTPSRIITISFNSNINYHWGRYIDVQQLQKIRGYYNLVSFRSGYRYEHERTRNTATTLIKFSLATLILTNQPGVEFR